LQSGKIAAGHIYAHACREEGLRPGRPLVAHSCHAVRVST
jgi:hypothetical protein